MSKTGSALRVRIRHGRLDDLEQIRGLTRDTFSWGDYLAAAWPGWVRSRRGVLLVALVGSEIVGTCHLRLLEHREGWLEGLRVRHSYRQQGIGSRLIQAVHEHAGSNNCRIVRLETGAHNLAAQRAFTNHGYRRIVPYAGFAAAATNGVLAGARLAVGGDLNACWALWQRSWLKRASKTVVPAPYGWRWWELTRARLAAEIQNQRLWVTRDAFMTLRVEDDAFDITLLVGARRGAMILLEAARVLAQRAHKKNVFWVTPHVARSSQWAGEAGYSLDEDGLLIYECAL